VAHWKFNLFPHFMIGSQAALSCCLW
jgi:hypothetical protein